MAWLSWGGGGLGAGGVGGWRWGSAVGLLRFCYTGFAVTAAQALLLDRVSARPVFPGRPCVVGVLIQKGLLAGGEGGRAAEIVLLGGPTVMALGLLLDRISARQGFMLGSGFYKHSTRP